jgi:hypothetical protein
MASDPGDPGPPSLIATPASLTTRAPGKPPLPSAWEERSWYKPRGAMGPEKFERPEALDLLLTDVAPTGWLHPLGAAAGGGALVLNAAAGGGPWPASAE